MADLKIRNLHKGFDGHAIIKGIDLDVRDREFVVFVGPSGCGKSTLLRLIAGLEEVSSGSITLDGTDITDTAPAKRDLAMVFQTYALYPHMTVRKNLSFALDLAGVGKQEVTAKVDNAARILELQPLLERKPRQLSGGQRQRVAIGRAIVRNPKIFLFDEPLSNLDAKLRGHMRAELAVLHERLGKTTVYVTHDQVEAMTLASRIVIFDKGVIQQVGTPAEVFNHPANLFVASFIGSPTMNLLPGRLTDDGFIQGPGLSLAAPADRGSAGRDCTVGIRPQALCLAQGGEPSLRMQVRMVEYLGAESVLVGHLEGHPQTRLTAVVPGHRSDLARQGADLAVQASDLHLFDTASGHRLQA